MGYCDEGCEYLTRRHNCNKYHKGLTYFSHNSKSLAYSSHERCSECDKDHIIADLEAQRNKSWIPVSERLPEDIVNPITRDAYVYPVTVDLGGITDIRYYSFCRGHWYNQGPKEMDELVIAWQARPEPYRPE